ncbi:hypothetical protein ASE92_17940 [Pedobacter sp. Leaf41]|uniref:hypothetical protein n=1 Tax=Pedobacter sp. Leaf41 TaxID=1736218 RepID=UPI0007037FFD|nr:hypothetical protein [Pedobacter sp. Leaf41]KQN32481.1 hypothetical protein ASE92_17940 [Pedobacter sp. Leaf41]
MMIRKLTLLCLLSCLSISGFAQSPTYINTYITILAADDTVWYGDVTFGSDIVVYLEDGTTTIFYGKKMVILPDGKLIATTGYRQIGMGRVI